MSSNSFHTPQRQSVTGIVLIFATSLYRIIRNFWAVAVYLLVMDPDPRFILFAALGAGVVLFGALGYSIAYYLKFIFYVDEERDSFILQKGVFNSDFISIPFSKIQQVNFQRNILQRLIGVYSVVIDTAGSTDKEVEIKALSKEKADELAELLMDLSAREKEEAKSEVEAVEKISEGHGIEWQYKLGFGDLLKLGLTSNYLRGLSILLAFYFTVRSQFTYTEDFTVDVPYAAVTEMFSTLVLIVILLIVGMIITVAETFIKYFGLHLIKTRSGLQVEMGLRKNTRVNLKSRRVQLLQESTNAVQRRLDLHKLKISLASSRDDLDKDQIKVPGLPQQIVSKVRDYFYGKEIKENFSMVPHKILLFRKISRRIFPLAAGLAVLFIFAEGFPWWWIGAGGGLVILLVGVYQYFYFRTVRLGVADDFLVKHSGLWTKKKEYIEMYKLQSVSVSQPVWYKRRGLADINFHSAGGDISFPLVSKPEVSALMDYLIFRIESTSKPWM